ncbi:MAG: MarR family transcriptional regulator [Ignavibacteriales bacterium]|nr:MarR family transcriptional regulator [Ignavibacteriales bacterium]
MNKTDKLFTTLEFVDIIYQAHGKLKFILQKIALHYELTAAQLDVLIILKANGPSQLNKISRKLMVTAANVTCITDNLEKDGFIKRIYPKDDRRIIIVELTKKGEQKLEKLLPDYENQIMNMWNKLSKIEQKNLIATLEKITK